MSDEARGDQWGVHSIDRCSIPKGAIGDFQRGAGRWASKSNPEIIKFEIQEFCTLSEFSL